VTREAGDALRRKKRVKGVSKSYVATLESAQRRHFGPVLGARVKLATSAPC
jgi:hypothetical protein